MRQMGDTTDPGQPTTPRPDGWQSDPERRYARLQSRLADHYCLQVDSRTTDTDTAGRVHYLAAGDPRGEPVLLLHGITEPAAIWLPVVSVLADRYRVYAPDMPGEGLSSRPNYRGRDLRLFMTAYLRELLDELGVDRPHVVAHSLGGWQAFLLAIDHGRVDRLCLVGAPVGVSREFPLLVRLFTVRGISRLLFWAMTLGDPIETAREWVRRFGVVDDSGVPETFLELYATREDLPGLRRSLRSLMLEAGSFGRMRSLTDIREEIVGIERPTGFIWGSEDYYWSPERGRAVADRMSDAEFHELPDHGHTPWLEPGDEVETRLQSFLTG